LANLRTLLTRTRPSNGTGDYQLQCSSTRENDAALHAAIANSTVLSHHIMQDCLNTFIALEKWDCATLQMPENLRIRQMQELLREN
jgi:glutathione synthase/RimK-type ligase-like ATP-grasp enzyme